MSLAWDEPLHATASIVRNWVLVEQPGAWGPDAVGQSGLSSSAAATLLARGRQHGFRVLLLRRSLRPADGSRHCFVAHSGRGSRWIEQRVVSDLDELLGVDFSPLRHGRPVGFGEIRDSALHLVCTNGRHDPCCANLGRPVARALQGRPGDSVWECSHFGGDRFAGNLVCLPHGLYFGRLGPMEARAVVEGYERGVVDLDHYRGRAGEPFVVQAAEFFVRRDEAVLGVDDLAVAGWRSLADGVVEVGFAGPEGRKFEVRVAARPAPDARPLSCQAAATERPPTYSLLELNLV